MLWDFSKESGNIVKQSLDPFRPSELSVKGYKIVVQKDKLDLLAFLLLHPYYDKSINNKTGAGFYYLQDTEREAREANRLEKESIKAKHDIFFTYDEETLRAYLQSKGHKNISLMSEDEVRNSVAKIAAIDYLRFNAEIKSSDVSIKADITGFIEAKIIYLKEFNGRKEWRLGFGEGKGDPICEVQVGVTKEDALTKFLLSNLSTYDALRREYASVINNSVSNKKSISKETKIDTPVIKETIVEDNIEDNIDDNAIKDMKAFIKDGIVQFYPLHSTVSIFIDGKKVKKEDGGTLLSKTTVENWEDDLFKITNQKLINEIKATIGK